MCVCVCVRVCVCVCVSVRPKSQILNCLLCKAIELRPVFTVVTFTNVWPLFFIYNYKRSHLGLVYTVLLLLKRLLGQVNLQLQHRELSVLISWFGLVWLGWVLWHINHLRLFKSKSSLYIYIKYIWFGLVGFYGISIIVGYLMPNPLYTYILNIYDLVWFGFMAYQPL